MNGKGKKMLYYITVSRAYITVSRAQRFKVGKKLVSGDIKEKKDYFSLFKELQVQLI